MALPCLAHLLVLLPFLCTVIVCSSPTHHKQEKVLCIEEERQALLTFKDGLRSSNSLLESSWVGGDCCNWMGVGCNNTTGHVIRLDLRSASIDVSNDNESGELNTSLLELNHLEYLDLSNNSFGSKLIPKFFGSFKKLTYLNLSCALFHGAVPSQLGNLSRLQSLDLSSHPSLLNCWNFNILNVNDFRWVSHLSSLKYLGMGGVNLIRANDWLKVTNLLPSLSTLSLPSCALEKLPILTHPNFTALTHLDLSDNNVASKFPSWLVNLTHLQYLDLSYNSFEGPIPSSIGCLCNLQVLSLYYNKMEGEVSGFLESLSKCCSDDLEKDGRSSSIRELYLGRNNFSGTVPESVGQLLGLEQLALGSNNFSGTVPDSVGQLSKLERLVLNNNSLEGVMYEAHFANLTRLKDLRLSGNSLVFNVSQDWIPPPKLEVIALGSCRLGPKFPRWLRFFKDYSKINVSNAQISDAMPTWFWNLSSKATDIDLSSNNISGKIPTSLEFYIGRVIDLSSNRFEGFLPYHVSNAHIMSDVHYSDTALVARDNFLNGSIPSSFCDFKSLYALDLSNNQITGKIPSCFGKFSNLYYLDLSNNSLDGEIPSFSAKLSRLQTLFLENNNLTGQIPSSIAKLVYLSILNLSNNSLVGTIPKRFESSYLGWLSLSHNQLHGVHPLSFASRTNGLSSESYIPFVAIDLSKNRLSGSLTTWMWENLTQLRFLNLRSNMFHGNIPPQLSLLTSLQILDLSDNHLSGVIPSSFSNFTAMSRIHDPSEALNYAGFTSYYFESRYDGFTSNHLELSVIMKGNELEYTKTIGLLKAIDLSGNGLSGEIPKGLVRLIGLKSLNLSRNQLEGSIPKDIGNLLQLESLDFSRNHLSGTIPSSISELNFLSRLNLSYNNLSGHIPSGRQLQTLNDGSIYAGNYNLCGPPLSECPDGPSPTSLTFNGGDEEDRSKLLWFSMGAMMGFVIGFWAICGILILNKSWRISYYGFFDRLIARLGLLVVNIILKVRK